MITTFFPSVFLMLYFSLPLAVARAPHCTVDLPQNVDLPLDSALTLNTPPLEVFLPYKLDCGWQVTVSKGFSRLWFTMPDAVVTRGNAADKNESGDNSTGN